ncbi:HlyD family secretion protein [Aliiroseovarius sp. 2305UL8-7]|uniref:HlyD family secretion protein n=1 Tax=Aliiroseovarius conchicola TaxID=3121637 RepID=UPI0035278011
MKKLQLIAVALLIITIGVGLWAYWRHSELYPSTDDAYVRANIVTMAAQVSGQVNSVKVTENQLVKAGDVLVELDAEVFNNAVKEGAAQVESATAAGSAYDAQINAATASVNGAQTALDAAQAQLSRVQTLFKKGDVAQAALDNARTATAQAQAGLNTARAQLSQARSAQITNQDALVSAQAQLATAKLNLEHAKITAPTDGWIANIRLREGSTVAAYQPLFSLVEAGDWWVDANFKETDMVRIKSGQKVTVSIDMLPGKSFEGEVASIGPGSGATFALLPAENASGNWVKVTQRFPIRITFMTKDDQFRAGASASVKVDTTGHEAADSK